MASAAEQDPIGSAGAITRLLAIELPTPWGEDFYMADPEGTVRQRLNAIRLGYFQRLREAGQVLPPEGYPNIYGIAPDREWSVPGQRRVLLALRPGGLSSGYEMTEYLFPAESPLLVEMARVFFETPEELAAFDRFKTGEPPRREFFVCTHGHVDICCARFGVPLYRQARAAYPLVRAWRMTHFGGHRYSPTAWEFPSGYKWGFLDHGAARQVLAQDGPTDALARKLRGWSALPAQVQVLDREGLLRTGWEWLMYRRAGAVLAADEAAERWHVRLEFEGPRQHGVYEGTVTVGRKLLDPGCGPRWGQHEAVSREYRLERFTERYAR
jgi:hypothetical protein